MTGEKLLVKEQTCPICFKVYSSSSNLNTHMLGRHSEQDKGNYICSSCDKGFIRLCDLNNHKKSHRKGSLLRIEMPFKCKFCHVRFKLLERLEVHQDRHTDKYFVCKSCDFRAHDNGKLKSHAKIHSQEFLFACSYCDKKFRHRNSRVIHERSHTGEKPYKCVTCDKLFSQATHLLAHKRSVHSESNHECTVCKKIFKSENYLRKHSSFMHSNKRNF